MKIAEFRGQFHKITNGRVDDFVESIHLAVEQNPKYGRDRGLRSFFQEQDIRADHVPEVTSRFGSAEKLVICIAGCDDPSIGPIGTYNSPGSEKFFDLKRKDLRTYFDRLTLIKKALAENPVDIPWEKVTLFPSYPKHHYPYFQANMQSEEHTVFRYMCVETPHHYNRVKRTPKPIPTVFRNYIRQEDAMISRDSVDFVDHCTALRNEDEYLLFHPCDADSPRPIGHHYSHEAIVHFYKSQAQRVLEVASKRNLHAVFGIPFVYGHPDHTTCNWFESHCELEDHLQQLGADMTRTHITYRLQEFYHDRYDEKRKAFSYPSEMTSYP